MRGASRVRSKAVEDRHAYDEASWSAYLSAELDRPVLVRFGRARQQVIVARPVGRNSRRLEIRMNRFFAEAPADVRAAAAQWLRAGRRARRACERLDGWIAETVAKLPPAAERAVRFVARGSHHDLTEIMDGLLEREFAAGPLRLDRRPRVGWGRRGRARRSIQLGSYDVEHHAIRIHPVLDQPAVPRFFVRYVLYHELLHAVIPDARTCGGRQLHHGSGFRRHEEAYPDYERALSWQGRNLRSLLHSARTSRPMRVAKRGGPLPWLQKTLFDG